MREIIAVITLVETVHDTVERLKGAGVVFFVFAQWSAVGCAQASTDFIANPALVRMTSTNPANRDRGNYVMFENVSPAPDGTLLPP